MDYPSHVSNAPPVAPTLTLSSYEAQPVVHELIAVEGRAKGQRFALLSDTLVVGRNTFADIWLDDRLVSNRHCVLERTAQGYVISDRDSRNGTFAGRTKERLAKGEQRLLESGDPIWIGSTKFLYVESAETMAVSDSALPFPLAAARALVAAEPHALARVKAAADAIEIDAKFLAAVALGWLRASRHDVAAVANVLQRRRLDQPLTLGAWVAVALDLAELVDEDTSAVGRALVALSQSRTAKHLRAAVQERNRVFHASRGLAAESFSQEGALLEDTLEQLHGAVSPLGSTRMVSVVEIDAFDDEDGPIAYVMRLHQGPSETFPIVQDRLVSRLRKSWAYLLDGRRTLSLSPFFYAQACATCRRIEVFGAERLQFGPIGSEVILRGLLSTHPHSVRLPKSDWDAELHISLSEG